MMWGGLFDSSEEKTSPRRIKAFTAKLKANKEELREVGKFCCFYQLHLHGEEAFLLELEFLNISNANRDLPQDEIL